ncbi:MAG: hypothetical protein ACPLTR_11920 [Thermacetogeniaceae bacterium]
MDLTKRQLEFLKCIFEHYIKHQNPIHYTTVAKRLGVSKWTAYDMLKRLRDAGYLKSHYGVKERRNPGRSQLFYTPTSKLQQLMEEKAVKQDDWIAWTQLLVDKIKRLQSAAGEEAHSELDELLALLPEAKGPIMYCAGLIALFMGYLIIFNKQGTKLIRQITDLIKKPEERLALLSGTILGTLFKDPSPPGKEGMITGLINSFHQQLAKISLKQHQLLAGFLSELLQAVS